MKMATFIIMSFFNGRGFVTNNKTTNIRLVFHCHKMMSVKNQHNAIVDNFKKLYKDKSHTKSDDTITSLLYKISNFL